MTTRDIKDTDTKDIDALRAVLRQARPEQLRRLLDDIRDIPAWHDRDPMGRA